MGFQKDLINAVLGLSGRSQAQAEAAKKPPLVDNADAEKRLRQRAFLERGALFNSQSSQGRGTVFPNLSARFQFLRRGRG